MEDLKFRRQFLLTKNNPENIPDNWKLSRIDFNNEIWNLFSHPDLTISQIDNNHHTLILAGYFVDPFRPALTNEDILKELILQPDAESLIERTHILNGRFLLFSISKEDFYVFSDATCFRELYYLFDNSTIHCGSTPDIINHFIGAKLTDNKEVFELLNSKTYATNDHTWIGYDTTYSNLKRLVPNFLLDLKTQSIKRFWPLKPLQKLKPEDIAVDCAKYIRGCLHGISNRYPIHLGVTAGWDSRMLLAASETLKQDIFYYINVGSGMSESHVDLKTAETLSKKLGFKLNKIILNDVEIDSEFSKIFHGNNFRAHEELLPVFFYGYMNKYDNTITVSGNLSEGTARQYCKTPLKLEEISGKHFLDVIEYGESSYAEKILDHWIKDIIPLCKKYNIDIFDLYQMEMESTNWCNLSSSVQDITREEMRPFNSRYLMEKFWSIESKYRFKYNPLICKMMIKHLWKESLDVAVNPSYKSSVIKILGFLKLDYFVYNIILRMKYFGSVNKKVH